MTDSLRPDQAPSVGAAADAFRSLFEREFAYVWATLRRLGVHARDLEDVTHDVFVQVHKRWGDYDASRPIRPWLFAFAYRFASDYRNLARHRIELLDRDVDVAAEAPSAHDRLASAEDQRLVADALAAIDLDRRAVFILHDIDGVAVPDIAATLEIPLNTAYSRLRLAREEFTSAVKRLRSRRGDR